MIAVVAPCASFGSSEVTHCARFSVGAANFQSTTTLMTIRTAHAVAVSLAPWATSGTCCLSALCHASRSAEVCAHLFAEADTMHMFIWQKDLISVACYICACKKLHATLLGKQDPYQPSWGWML